MWVGGGVSNEAQTGRGVTQHSDPSDTCQTYEGVGEKSLVGWWGEWWGSGVSIFQSFWGSM